MLKKLRLKIVAVAMSIVLAMLIVIFGLIYHFTQVDLQSQADSALDKICAMVEQPGYPGTRGADVQVPYFVLQINVWGDVLASGVTYLDLENEQLVQSLIRAVNGQSRDRGYLEDLGLQYRVMHSPAKQSIVFVDISGHSATLASLITTSLVTGAISLAVFLVLAILLAQWAVKPVERAWDQQKQFVSDASHELKTPLTVIMSNAELLENEKELSEEGRQFNQNVLTMTKKMRNLVEGLLELSRADNGQVRKQFATVDLSSLVEEAVLPFEPAMYEQGLMLQSTVEPGISCFGNEQYLRQVVDILLDNARKYSAPGTVGVQLRRMGRGQCLLTVCNPGQPIAPEELKKIFDRFYRSDSARSNSGSFGLGLSIAKSVIGEHNGRIWAESRPGGNCFYVQLPTV